MAVLVAEDICFGYASGTLVLEHVNLQVEQGERVALQAASGRGKSTLCQILAGYLKPDAGRVLLDGKEPRACKGKANPVQLIWQHPEQAVDPYIRLSETVKEAGEVPQQLLDDLGIKPEWLTRYPHELSGGELQRCCIARALAVEPQFIVADETSTMLDAITQAQLWRFLLDYCEKNQVGMVLVTHSQALLERLATRVVEL